MHDADNSLKLSLGAYADTLIASLSNAENLVLVGEIDGLAQRMAKVGATRAESSQSYGAAIFKELLPERFRTFFENTTASALTLNVDQQLANVDWQLTYDGREFWNNKFKISVAPKSPDTSGGTTRSHLQLDTQRTLRQLTVLSYDLVGSTDLIRDWDKENYSLRLEEMHRQLTTIVKRWGGISDLPQGDDGIMCYFGVHHLREDTVHCALHAALELAQEAQRLQMPVRFGVATGEIAVSSVHLIGEDINLAARIQKVAPLGAVLTSHSTAELAKTYFNLAAYSSTETLKGFPKAQTLYLLHGPKPLHDRAPNAESDGSILLGRQAEMDRLLEGWATAVSGTPRWLHVTGEVGIGKSRLVASFIHQLQPIGGSSAIVCRCYAETSGRAFSPIVDMLERWFQVLPSDSVDARSEKISQSIAENGIAPHDQIAVKYLLGLPHSADQDPLFYRPKEPRRQFIMRTMAHWLMKQAQNQAMCLVVEDLQWADPSTLDFLRCLRDTAKDCSLLVLLTERSSLDQNLGAPIELADGQLRLGRLAASAVRNMIDALTAHASLPQHVVDAIAAKSDGVPLFVEMSTRAVLESPLMHAGPAGLRLTGDFPIPPTLNGLLMQRLDNLGPARQFAQFCSVIGREIPRQMLLALCDSGAANMPPAQAQLHLAALLRSGLVLTTTDTQRNVLNYYFRHALIHEVAYQSMWRTDRLQLHSGIAKAIVQTLPEMGTAQPEVLAQHYEASGDLAEGFKWHLKAARKYKQAEAHVESLAHLAAAKHLLLRLPGSTEVSKTMLDTELTMAGQLIATKGYGSDGAGQSYRSALSLAQTLGDKKAMLRAQLGLEAYYLMRADFGQAHAYLIQAQATALEFNDALTRSQCLFALANVLHHQGHAKAMQEVCEQCLQVCRNSDLQEKLVQSPEVMSLMYSAVCLWEIGQVDFSVQRASEGVDKARQLGQRLGLGQALGMQAMVLLWCGDLEPALRISQEAIDVCQAGGHDMWSAHARLIHGACVCELGEPERGLQEMDAAYELWTATGTVVTRTFYLVLRAQANAGLGRIESGLGLVAEASRIVKEHGERYYEPEVLRVKGELLLLQAEQNASELCDARQLTGLADAAFAEARATAVGLGYASLALRAAASQARRCLQTAARASGIEGLRSALAVLQSGANTRDQLVACQILEQLREFAD